MNTSTPNSRSTAAAALGKKDPAQGTESVLRPGDRPSPFKVRIQCRINIYISLTIYHLAICSHAQKYSLKVQKNGTVAHVPPPHPKRKTFHPYPQKSPKNALMPLQATMAYSSSFNFIPPGYPTWDDASVPMNAASSVIMPSQDDQTVIRAEGMFMHTRFC